MKGVLMTPDELAALRERAEATKNTDALQALEMMDTVLMARHMLQAHINKFRDLWHAERHQREAMETALRKASAWMKHYSRKLKKDDIADLVEQMHVEIRCGLPTDEVAA
jgi:phosphoenolpyruvate-protein kinase (PTS system EI component)